VETALDEDFTNDVQALAVRNLSIATSPRSVPVDEIGAYNLVANEYTGEGEVSVSFTITPKKGDAKTNLIAQHLVADPKNQEAYNGYHLRVRDLTDLRVMAKVLQCQPAGDSLDLNPNDAASISYSAIGQRATELFGEG
jgi:hypothetical protein